MRPPLSKAYLAGEIGADALIYKAPIAYEKANVEVRLGLRVDGIDRSSKRLLLEGGQTQGYDKLVIANRREGPRTRRPRRPVLAISFTSRSIADVEAFATATPGGAAPRPS